MFKRLLDLFLPFHQIAQELRILRELYEEELASHNPPIRRVTEKPDKGDTEVSNMNDDPKPPGILRKMLEDWNSIEPVDDEDDQYYEDEYSKDDSTPE